MCVAGFVATVGGITYHAVKNRADFKVRIWYHTVSIVTAAVTVTVTAAVKLTVAVTVTFLTAFLFLYLLYNRRANFFKSEHRPPSFCR